MIFSNVNKQKPMVSRLITSEDDFNASSVYMEALLILEEEYFEINKTHVYGTHLALKEQNLEILNEAFGDFIDSVVKFFKKMIENFKEIMKKLFMFINAYLGDFENFLNKYKDRLSKLDPDFEVSGYKYKFNQNTPRLDRISNLINQYNSELSDLENMKKEDIIAERQRFMDESNLSKIRAEVLCVSSSVSSENYIDECKRVFRSGDDEEIQIKVDKHFLNSVIIDYPTMKKTLNEVARERDKVISLIESIKNFFSRSATVYYKGQTKTIYAYQIKQSDSNSYINKTDKVETAYSAKKIETLNTFFNFKYAQAKELGDMCVSAMVEKANALKECLKFYRTVIRKSLTGPKKQDENNQSLKEGLSSEDILMEEFKGKEIFNRQRISNDGFVDMSGEFENQTEVFHAIKKLIKKNLATINSKTTEEKAKILTKKDFDLNKDAKEEAIEHVNKFNSRAKENNSKTKTGLIVLDGYVLCIVFNEEKNEITKVYCIFRHLAPKSGQSHISFDDLLVKKE